MPTPITRKGSSPRLMTPRVAPDLGGREPWRDQAACKGLMDVMFPRVETPTALAAAVGVCLECPVMTECRSWVDQWPQSHGVWAGLTARERRVRP